VLVGNKRPEVPTLTEKAIVGLLRESLSVNFGDVGAGEVGGSFQSKL
jgi:ribonuclease P/MRP protein subunit POP5